MPGKVIAMKRASMLPRLPVCLAVTIAVAAMSAEPAWAQTPGGQMICGKRNDILRQLDEKYGETRRSLGLAQGRGVVELYASDETGSWTILLTNPQGTTCMMAAGEAFR